MPVLLCWLRGNESVKLGIARPHLRMCDRWAVNLQIGTFGKAPTGSGLFLSLEDLALKGPR